MERPGAMTAPTFTLVKDSTREIDLVARLKEGEKILSVSEAIVCFDNTAMNGLTFDFNGSLAKMFFPGWCETNGYDFAGWLEGDAVVKLPTNDFDAFQKAAHQNFKIRDVAISHAYMAVESLKNDVRLWVPIEKHFTPSDLVPASVSDPQITKPKSPVPPLISVYEKARGINLHKSLANDKKELVVMLEIAVTFTRRPATMTGEQGISAAHPLFPVWCGLNGYDFDRYQDGCAVLMIDEGRLDIFKREAGRMYNIIGIEELSRCHAALGKDGKMQPLPLYMREAYPQYRFHGQP